MKKRKQYNLPGNKKKLKRLIARDLHLIMQAASGQAVNTQDLARSLMRFGRFAEHMEDLVELLYMAPGIIGQPATHCFVLYYTSAYRDTFMRAIEGYRSQTVNKVGRPKELRE